MEPGSCEPPRRLRIHVDGGSFSVDGRSLAEHCEYFRALFRSGMRESRQDEIRLRGLGVPGFLALLRVLDGERPPLDGDQIVAAIECAAFLQAPALARHLVDLVTSENCLLMYHTAAAFGVWELSGAAALFARDVYADLREDVRALPARLAAHLEALRPSSYVAVCSHSPAAGPPPDAQRAVRYLDEERGAWRVLTHLPAAASTVMAGVAVLGDRLYVVGGVRDVTKKVVESGFCYDPAADAWSTIRGPRQPRYNFSLIAHGDSLYAVGGECEAKALASVERYAVPAGSWSRACALPAPAASVASAVAMSRVFVCLWRGNGATDVLEYAPRPDSWLPLTTLTRRHSYGLRMVAHRDDLYVMRNGPGDDFLLCVMDCYNLTSGQWTAVAGQYGSAGGSLLTAAVRGDSVFTLGRHATTEYAVDRRRWRARREMEGFGRIGSIYAFLMRLPKAAATSKDSCPDPPRDQNLRELGDRRRLSPQCSENL